MRNFRHGRVGLLTVMLVLTGAPAFAQIELAGNWAARLHEDFVERNPGPTIVDYLGSPINEEARNRALTNHPSRYTLPERQCLHYTMLYIVMGPQSLRIWSDIHPVTGHIVAYNISSAVDRSVMTIWMDGRPHPPEGSLHTFAGFTTGRWEGTTLVTTTTHATEGPLRRNGLPASDKAVITMYFSRHEDLLSVTAFHEDPIYLTEPYVVSRVWQLDEGGGGGAYSPCWITDSELFSLKSLTDVPNYLPGQNPFVEEMTKWYNIPVDAVLGGAETMYPEYQKRFLREKYKAPDKCTRYCDGNDRALEGRR
jgi:hypothetical protein